MRGPLHHVHLSPRSWVHLLFQSITVGHRFEFHANGVGDGDDGSSLECEGGQHRTELMHFERVITFHQHIPAPITDADDERVDLEIGWRLPRAKDLQDSLLCIFVLDGRALRTLVPSDHVLHSINLSFTRGRVAGLAVSKVYAHRHTRVERYLEDF
jgi:hypothetical protein